MVSPSLANIHITIQQITILISIRVTSSIMTVRDPNLYRRRKLDPIPNPLLVLLFKGKTYTPGLMRGWRRSDFEGPMVLRWRQTRFKLTRPNLLTRHFQSLSNSYWMMNQGKKKEQYRPIRTVSLYEWPNPRTFPTYKLKLTTQTSNEERNRRAIRPN